MERNKIFAVIPARGGSKGIPKKNIKNLAGKPLIYYTIETARQVFDDNQILVSTDALEIAEVITKTGLQVPFMRPESLATDTSGTHEVLLHAVTYLESIGQKPEVLVLLQPTSPFRSAQQTREAIELFTDEVDMVVSVKQTKANPYYNLFEENEQGFLKKSKKSTFTRRQDCPKVYELNGAIYVIRVSTLKQQQLNEFKRVKKYVMDEMTSMDLDTPFDWILAETHQNI